MTTLSRASKLCSTCAFWAGTRQAKPDGQVEIHPYSKGHCQGGGFRVCPDGGPGHLPAMANMARGRAGFGPESGY